MELNLGRYDYVPSTPFPYGTTLLSEVHDFTTGTLSKNYYTMTTWLYFWLVGCHFRLGSNHWLENYGFVALTTAIRLKKQHLCGAFFCWILDIYWKENCIILVIYVSFLFNSLLFNAVVQISEKKRPNFLNGVPFQIILQLWCLWPPGFNTYLFSQKTQAISAWQFEWPHI